MAERTVSVRLAARVDQYVAAMRAAAASTTGFAASTERNLTRVGGQMQNVGRMATIGLSVPIVAAAGFAVKAAVDWESAWAGVTKTVDGTVQEMAVLEQGLRDMTKEVSASHGEIAAVAEAAGALGVAQEDILDFTRVMVDLGETTDLTSDQAATAIAQMMNVMQTAPDDVDNLGAALVHLGNNGASTESQILDMATRIAGAGEIVGLSEAEVLGFASALASMGIEAEAGGSAFSRVISDISKAVSQGGDDLDTFASVAGVSASAFATAFREDPAAAIVSFVDGLGRIHASGGDVFGVLEKLGLSDVRVSRALLSMATSGDLLTTSLDDGAQAWEANTALAEEAAKRYDTAGARFEMVRNKIVDLFIDLGEIILPAVEAVVDVIGTLAEQFQSLPQPLQIAVGGFLGLVAAMGPMVFLAGSVMKNLTAISTQLPKVGSAAGKASLALGAIGIALTLGAIAYEMFTGESREAEARTADAAAALEGATGRAWDYAAGVEAAGGEVDGFTIAQMAMSEALTTGSPEAEALAQALGALGMQASDATEVILSFADGNEAAMVALAESAGAVGGNAEILANYVDEVERLGSGPAWSNLLNDIFDGNTEHAQTFVAANREVIDALTEVNHQATQLGSEGLADMATVFLNGAVAASKEGEALVELAEKHADASRAGDESLSVYEAFNEILEEMTPTERAAALAAAGLTEETLAAANAATDAAGGFEDAGGAIGEMGSVAASSIDTMSNLTQSYEDAATKVGIYRDALDRALGPSGQWIRAHDGFAAGLLGFNETLDDSSDSLDYNTEAGLANRSAVMDMADELVTLTESNIESGKSQRDVTDEYLEGRSALIEAAAAAGLNRGEVIELLNAYGLTPELITTTMNLAGTALAEWRIQRFLDELNEIPEEEAVIIEALIDEDKIAEAEARLAAIQDEDVWINIRENIISASTSRAGINTSRGSGWGGSGAALGAYIPEDGVWQLHANEAVMPLSNPMRMRELAADPRIGEPLMAALGNLMPVPQTAFAPAVAPQSTSVPSNTINTGDIHVGSRQDLPDLYNELGRVQFLSQFAGSRG